MCWLARQHHKSVPAIDGIGWCCRFIRGLHCKFPKRCSRAGSGCAECRCPLHPAPPLPPCPCQLLYPQSHYPPPHPPLLSISFLLSHGPLAVLAPYFMPAPSLCHHSPHVNPPHYPASCTGWTPSMLPFSRAYSGSGPFPCPARLPPSLAFPCYSLYHALFPAVAWSCPHATSSLPSPSATYVSQLTSHHVLICCTTHTPVCGIVGRALQPFQEPMIKPVLGV